MAVEVFYDLDEETPLSIQGDVVRADWYNAGEGWNGDYDPDDPDDDNLLRFDIYVRADDGWEEVEDASYCTRVKADAPFDVLEDKLMGIYRMYADEITDPYDYPSVKKLGEGLSWME